MCIESSIKAQTNQQTIESCVYGIASDVNIGVIRSYFVADRSSYQQLQQTVVADSEQFVSLPDSVCCHAPLRNYRRRPSVRPSVRHAVDWHE